MKIKSYEKDVMKIFKMLLAAYGERYWWPAKTDFEMMIGAILTQNTTWQNVEKAINNMEEHLRPEIVAKVDLDQLGEMIRSSGYYNQKAKKLKALVDWYFKYDYDTDKAKKIDGQTLREELLGIHGVGNETADCILTYALDKPYFVIDTYTRRIFYRLGFDVPKKYDEFRLMIENSINKDLYIFQEYHALLVEHAKIHCKKTPDCVGCPLEEICLKRIG